jgi:hypothetical protein
MTQDPMGFDAGDSNLYRYAACRPAKLTDPSGLHVGATANAVVLGESAPAKAMKNNPLPGGELIGANNLGAWMGKQTPQKGLIGGFYKTTTNLRFFPDESKIAATDIGFIQIFKITDSITLAVVGLQRHHLGRRNTSGWIVDRSPDKIFGWYGTDNNGNVIVDAKGNANKGYGVPWNKAKGYVQMNDAPEDNVGNRNWRFQAYAVVKTGDDHGRVLGGVSWGFMVSNKLQITPLPFAFISTPTKEFFSAVAGWNRQAIGDPKDSNAPGAKKKQQIIGECPLWYQ